MTRNTVAIAILGSTGSIGRQTLEVIHTLESRFKVIALAAGSNLDLLLEQIREFQPAYVSLGTVEAMERLRSRLAKDKHRPEVLWGKEGLLRLASLPEVETVVNGLVGAIGLEPTLAALRAGKRVCLANKESLVIGGHLIREVLSHQRGELIPIDSEHNTLFQLLEGRKPGEIKRLILTASGGAVRDRPLEELERLTPEEVLQHPNWRMGPRITVDSATLVNKGFEVIEAHWLFRLDYDRIEALLHPQSIVHGLIELSDGTFLAGLSPPDMRLPIMYALTYPEREALQPHLRSRSQLLDLPGMELTFAEIDLQRYPAFSVVLEAGRRGGTFPAVINAADEVLVERFLRREISFTKIALGLRQALEEHEAQAVERPDLEVISAADRWGREFARRWCA
ncbi:TPA: 1-deoxy-D-xylulose-5-phosphate reductoisomerase [Candidatus Bipolaricaulota bacterium]|nr:1-deoxy-D-xylulose-5-phosphate reductoisomerase [Candidatus Bipolaricaulota bacterium]